ncbi:MAG: hypothetical protein E5X69_31835, partial [Mesorhizobium sp.]
GNANPPGRRQALGSRALNRLPANRGGGRVASQNIPFSVSTGAGSFHLADRIPMKGFKPSAPILLLLPAFVVLAA